MIVICKSSLHTPFLPSIPHAQYVTLTLTLRLIPFPFLLWWEFLRPVRLTPFIYFQSHHRAY